MEPAWSASGRREEDGNVMGPTVTRGGGGSARLATSPPLKNGNEMRAAGYLVAVGSRTQRFRRKHKLKLIWFLLALLLLLLILFIVMTILYARQRRHRPIRVCESRECLRSAANLALSMDRAADPCQDFYQYACGNWGEEHPRPDALRSYDWFRDKQTRVYALVRDALSRNASTAPGPVQQTKEFYDACMDTETLDKLGLKPVIPVLISLGLPPYPTYVNITEDVDYSSFKFDWLETVIRIKTQLGMDVLIGFDLFTDPRNSSVYRLVMGSPETTNPFPSMHNEKKKHTGRRKTWPGNILHRSIFGQEKRRSEEKEGDTDSLKEKEVSAIYKLFYAELIKMFVEESGDDKTTTLTPTELDERIIETANDYFDISEDFYDLELSNDTDVDDDLYLSIPEYTVQELQTLTDTAAAAATEAPAEGSEATTSPAPGAAVWQRYLEGVFNASDVQLNFETDKILVSGPDLKYLALMTVLIAKTPPVTLQLYVWMKVVEVMSAHTTTELRLLATRTRQAARGRGGRGTGAGGGEPARSLLCADAANDMLGLAVAYAIADPHFLEVTKPKILTMVHELKRALAHLVGRARWMDDDTKLATFQKIIRMKTLVGFPDWLLEPGALEAHYAGLEVHKDTHLENMLNIIQFKVKKALNKFREGNNFTWATDPTEVNAYHTFQENTITVPLVMVQYPFFDLGLDSLNYGSLGTILGHEITHGFDNFGRQFDAQGNLIPWWSNATVAGFLNITKCFIDQYSGYYLAEVGEYVDGKKTLGENIADNGGLREALVALHQHMRHSPPEPKLPGFEDFSPEQLFFLSYGNLWCGVFTHEALAQDLDDEHAPQKLRAAGALANSAEFARAFRCRPGTPMNPGPKQRCVVF
ncbi:hypothetical protein O0L34_g13545 [Tuta absoluta]|nr:hypothetical protein O0L34_g13545 [Tuta absoluta]